MHKDNNIPRKIIEVNKNQVIYLNSLKDCILNMTKVIEALTKTLESIKK